MMTSISTGRRRTNRRVQVFDENGTFLDQWAYGKAGSSDAHSILMGGDRALWVVELLDMLSVVVVDD